MAPSIRRRRLRAAAQPPAMQSVRASAQRFPLKGREVQRAKIKTREWQTDAWDYFDEVPELKYSTWYMGNVMAKVRLFVAVRDDSDPEAPPIPAADPQSGLPAGAAQRAQAELDRLKGPLGGQGEIVRALNMNLEVAAEGFIIGIGPRETEVKDDKGEVIGIEVTPEEWGIYSISQLESKGGVYKVKLRPDDKDVRTLDAELDNEPIRVWQRHPRWTLEADNNMRGVLDVCETLVLLSNSMKAVAKSTMSAGYLLIPNELTSGHDADSETEPEEGEEATSDPLMQDLFDGAVDPVEDPSAAASVAPTMIRGPSEALKEFRHVAISREADNAVLPKIEACIERLARGLNLPVEVVMGHQQTTFANALQVKQDTFDDHFEPRCDLIVDALTVGYLVPNLIAAGMMPEIAERIIVWYDPSAMIKQVNPVDSADKGVEIGALALEAWRRAWGWSEDDAPNPEEQLVQAILKIGSFDPAITAAILDLLGVPLDIAEPAQASPFAASASVQTLLARAITSRYGDTDGKATLERLLVDVLEQRPAIEPAIRAAAAALPSPAKVARNPGYDLMLLDRELRARLLTAANASMTRALEKAGFVHPLYVAAQLGPQLVASAGLADDDLIGADAWDGLGVLFQTWVEAAQRDALAIAARVVSVTDAQRASTEQAQTRARVDAWAWLKDELHALALDRLYSPDPAEPVRGEFDATSRIPAGLMRQALARAGGATSIEPVTPGKAALRAADNVFVSTNNGAPVGGVGTGETIGLLLEDGSAGVEAYEWVYGPAYRLHPFEEHELLDGEVFENFDSDVLEAGDWVGDFYYPGDHDGCNCDFAPVIVEPGAIEDSLEAASATDTEADVVEETTDRGEGGKTRGKAKT